VAAHARSVRDLGQRDHAPADPRRDGDPLLGALDGAVSDGDRARRGTTRRRARRVGRARLLLARAESVVRCADRREGVRGHAAAPRERAAPGARHRAVHRGCDRIDRVRRARAARRRQRRARTRPRVRDRARHQIDRGTARAVAACRRADGSAARRSPTRRSQPGPDGARRDAVLADVAALPPLPARRTLHRRAHRPSRRAAHRRRAQEGERAAGARTRRAVDGRRRSRRARAPRARGPVRRPLGAAAGQRSIRDRSRARRYRRR
jgi:hypothetical protein